MTRCPCVRVCRRLAVSALTAFCLWRSAGTVADYLGSEDAYAYGAAWRAAARDAPPGPLALACRNASRIGTMERPLLAALAWERMPDPVTLVDGSAGLPSAGCVLSSRWCPKRAGAALGSSGFAAVSTNEHVKTWIRLKGGAPAAPRPREPAPPLWRELVSLGLLLAVPVFASVRFLKPRGRLAPTVAAAVTAALGAVALSHPLLAPNGLGVYGGRAKLWCLCGGMPSAFLSSDAGAVLQPAYPPGLSALAYLHFVLSGGCGDRLVQLLPVLAVGLLSCALLRDARTLREVLPVALFCLSPVAVRLTSGFYAEPFVALLLVSGWRLMREGRAAVGAGVLGLAGLFRPEAGVASVVFAFSAGLFRGGFAAASSAALPASVPTLVWFAACAAFGWGTVPDWSLLVAPKPDRASLAADVLLKTLWTQALPVLAVALLVRCPSVSRGCLRFRPWRRHAAPPSADCPRRNRRGLLAAWLPAALLLLAIPIVCVFYTAPSVKWMLDNTIPRLVWYLLAVPLAATLRGPRSAVRDSQGRRNPIPLLKEENGCPS